MRVVYFYEGHSKHDSSARQSSLNFKTTRRYALTENIALIKQAVQMAVRYAVDVGRFLILYGTWAQRWMRQNTHCSEKKWNEKKKMLNETNENQMWSDGSNCSDIQTSTHAHSFLIIQILKFISSGQRRSFNMCSVISKKKAALNAIPISYSRTLGLHWMIPCRTFFLLSVGIYLCFIHWSKSSP